MAVDDDARLPEWARELHELGHRDDVVVEQLTRAFGEWARAVALRPEERRRLWDRIVERADDEGDADSLTA